MTTDEEYYRRKRAEDVRHARALAKARNRGEVAKKWKDAGNVLTKETLGEFQSLMKKADRDWEKANP